MAEALPGSRLAGLVRITARVALKVYFRRVQAFHPERAPAVGPLLILSNHPGSLVDALVIGTSLPRRVHFVASVKLFRSSPVAWFLRQCGVIPINRRQDDPTNMQSVAGTFDACHRVFDHGGAIGLFPEGVTYDDARLKALKTGAARLALECVERHGGASGLQILPVGLTYSAKDRYRSDVLVHVGSTVAADAFAVEPGADAQARVRELMALIEQRLRHLIVNLPSLEHDRLVASVSRLYLERLRSGNLVVADPVARPVEALVLTQAIAAAASHFENRHPVRFQAFVDRLDQYERRVQMLGLSDHRLSRLGGPGDRRHVVMSSALLLLGAPIALYGWLHRVGPASLIRWAVANLTVDTPKAQTPLTAMLSGGVAFTGFYALYGGVAYQWWGWLPAVLYLLTLPPTGLFSHAWQLALREHGLGLRTSRVLVRAPLVRRDLIRRRAALIAELDSFSRDYMAAADTHARS